ncbi:MAG: oligosaccharide flippase family protein [Gemmatimonadaceae bacterium]
MPDPTLRLQAVRGGSILAARQGASLVLGLGATVVLTRLLGPAGYGQFAAALAIYAYIFLVAQLGINAYLLRRLDDDPAAYATARTLLMATAIIAFGIGAVALPWLERWLGGVGVRPLAMLLLAGLPLQLLMLVSLAALERALDYRVVAAAELAGIILMYSLSVLLAWRGFGPKAMVIGWWVQQVVMFVWLQRACGQPFRFGFDRGIARRTLAYGGSYAVSVWTLQLRELVNPLIVGRWLGVEGVAIVAIAVRLVEAASFVKTSAWRLALPTLARLQNAPAKLGAAVTEGMRLQLLVVGPMLLVLVTVSPWVIPTLFGDEWLAVRTILPLIAAGTLTSAMFNLHSSALFAMGRNAAVLTFNVIYVLLFAFAAWRLVPLIGVGGYGIAELMALPAYISIFLALRRATERPAFSQGVELTLGLFLVLALAGSAWDPRWALVALVPLASARVRAGIRDTYATVRGGWRVGGGNHPGAKAAP